MSKADLIKSLNSKIGATEAQKQKKVQNDEEARYQAMDINALGEEKLQAGKYVGKTCKTVYETDAQYVKWSATHQENNVKFLNLITFAKRMIATPSPATPKSSGGAPMNDVMSAGSFEDFLEADPRTTTRVHRSDGVRSPGCGPSNEEPGGATGANQSDAAAGDLPMPFAEHGDAGETRGPQSSPHHHGSQHGARAQVRIERSRSPVGRTGGIYTTLADDEGYLECIPEENIGNALDLSIGDLGCRGSYAFDTAKIQFGRFAWRAPRLPGNPYPRNQGLKLAAVVLKPTSTKP